MVFGGTLVQVAMDRNEPMLYGSDFDTIVFAVGMNVE
jgi:hypothetical protein